MIGNSFRTGQRPAVNDHCFQAGLDCVRSVVHCFVQGFVGAKTSGRLYAKRLAA